MPKLDRNGDPNYSVMDADDYWLTCTLSSNRTVKPLFGIVDSEGGGYIAFTTDEWVAQRLVNLLNNE